MAININLFEEYPIISAVKSTDNYEEVIKNPCKIVFLLDVNLSEVKETIEFFKTFDKTVFVHFDLINGLANNSSGLEYLVNNTNLDGIITTSSTLVKKAKAIKLPVIQRLFLIDSLSMEQGIKSVNESKPDAIEILPGIIPKQISEVVKKTNVPVIAGGFIASKNDVFTCLKAGAISISTSNKGVWKLE